MKKSLTIHIEIILLKCLVIISYRDRQIRYLRRCFFEIINYRADVNRYVYCYIYICQNYPWVSFMDTDSPKWTEGRSIYATTFVNSLWIINRVNLSKKGQRMSPSPEQLYCGSCQRNPPFGEVTGLALGPKLYATAMVLIDSLLQQVQGILY